MKKLFDWSKFLNFPPKMTANQRPIYFETMITTLHGPLVGSVLYKCDGGSPTNGIKGDHFNFHLILQLLKITLVGLFLTFAVSDAASVLKRRRIIKRPRTRQGRQLFGNRVQLLRTPVPAVAPALSFDARVALPAARVALPAARVAAPVPVRAAPAPIPVQVPLRAAPAPLPVPVAAPAPLPVRAPVVPLPAARTVQLVDVAVPRASALVEPIGITRSVYNAPGTVLDNLDAWNYAFEADNGIKQEAVGEMKVVGDSEVMVMRGSYEYIGADGVLYVVDWVADENGFRASAPHLPKNVPIPFPEQQAAVEAQLRFAAAETQERLATAASAPIATNYGAAAVAAVPEEAGIIELRTAPLTSYGLAY